MNILVIRVENFPYGTATSFRTLHILKLIALCGYNITIISKKFNADNKFVEKWNNAKTRIKCVSVDEQFRGSYKEAIESCLENEKYDAVIRPTSIRYFYEIDRTVQRYKLPQIFDSVEWYNASNWKMQYLDYRYYEFQYMWRFVFGKADGIVAISRLIQNYYKKSNTNVVRIPTITDCESIEYRTQIENKKIQFVFAGQLDNGKDNLDTFIEALLKVDPNGNKTQLDIYGPGFKEVKRHIGETANILEKSKNIVIHGKVPQQEAQKACLNSDYSVFFRKNRRSANAGFPTKLGECMTMGTPAICNDTGDISLVVKNRINGYLLKTKSVEEIADVLRHILTLSIEERENMRMEARKSAEKFFDYRNYQEKMKCVLENAIKGRK